MYNVPCKLLVSIIAIRISLQREKVFAQFIETVSKKFVLYLLFHWLIVFGLLQHLIAEKMLMKMVKIKIFSKGRPTNKVFM